MARKKHTPEEIIQHLRTLEIEKAKGASLEESARKISVSVQTLIRWRTEYGGLRVDQAKRLKELEGENARLKRIVADQAVDLQVLKEVAKGNF